MHIESKGLISRNLIKAKIELIDEPGIWIRATNKSDSYIKADVDNIISTQRNTVIGDQSQCICLTEHFLAACAITNNQNLKVDLSDEELPFDDGSALIWLKLFRDNNCLNNINTRLKLGKEIKIIDEVDSSKYLIARPSANDKFKATYHMDWKHPKIGKQSYSYDPSNGDATKLLRARTFSSLAENKMLGLDGWVIGMTEDDFDQKLHYKQEPSAHKLLDLIGDLMLSTFNPLEIAMEIESYKGGHELNSKLAKAIKLELS